MSQSFTFPPGSKDDYWDVVEDCLHNLHRLSRPDAKQRTDVLRGIIENPPPDISSDIFYHAEPFDVACDLAGEKLEIDDNRDEYYLILERHNW